MSRILETAAEMAQQIWREAHDCLETLDYLGLPKVEEGDFRQSLEHIRDLAEGIGGQP